MHPFRAVQQVETITKANQGCEKPRNCAGIPHKELQWLFGCSRVWNRPAAPLDHNYPVALLGRVRPYLDGKSQFLEGLDHQLRILAPERAFECRLTLAQRSEHQSAVGQ